MKVFAGSRGWLDYLLGAVCCLTAQVSVSLSVGIEGIAWLFGLGTLLGLAVSLTVVHVAAGASWLRWDGSLWTALAFLTALNVGPLNRVLPDGGFPFQIIAAAWLSWMIVLCSFVSWRDQTLLFLTLPCIALFGLVGTFENYAYGTAMFFAFLVSAATLYARVHHRTMIARAVQAGVPDPALLVRDRWRWMAGPEWAVGSAFVVVLISLLGAPAIRFSVQNVAGRINVTLPQETPAARRAADTSPEQTVGNGPQRLDETVMFRLKYSGERLHLRSFTYPVQTRRGWSRLERVLNPGDGLLDRRRGDHPRAERGPLGGVVAYPRGPVTEEIADPVVVNLEIVDNFAGNLALSAPGPVRELVGPVPSRMSFSPLGDVELTPPFGTAESMRLSATVPRTDDATPANSGLPTELARAASFYRDPGTITERVARFIRNAMGDERNDYRRARRLQLAISQAVNYNLEAAAVPTGADPVDHFLFKSREGYCDLFATAMTRCARYAGLPARYVVGYLLDPTDMKDGYINVRRSDYHAWSEIHFPGYGWVPFDATEGALDVSPSSANSGEAQRQGWWRSPAVPWLAGLVGLAAVAVLARTVFRRIAQAAPRVARPKLFLAQTAFVRALERASGERMRFSETLTEFAARTSDVLGEERGAALEAVRLIDRALYGPDGPEHDRAALESATGFAKQIRMRGKRG